MTPLRVDRSGVAARLSDIDRWIVEDLIDGFEPAARAAMAKVEKAKRKTSRVADPDRRDLGSGAVKDGEAHGD